MTDEPEGPPLALLDLDPELLVAVVQNLDVRSQCRVLHTCKLLALCVVEMQRTTSFLASGLASITCAAETLRPQLEATPTVGLCFTVKEIGGGGRPPTAHLLALARSLPPELELVGAHTGIVTGTDASGELRQSNAVCPHSRSETGENECAMTLGRFPEARVSSFAVDGGRSDWHAQLEVQGVLRGGAAGDDAAGEPWKVIVLLARHRETGAIIEALQRAHPAAAIIGGVAGGEQVFRLCRRRVEFYDEGVVGLCFGGNVPISAFTSRGARPIGDTPFTFGPEDILSLPDNADAAAALGASGAEPAGAEPAGGETGTQLLTHLRDSDGQRWPALRAAMVSLEAAGAAARGGLCVGLRGDDAGYELWPLDQQVIRTPPGVDSPSGAALALPPRRGPPQPTPDPRAVSGAAADDERWERGALRFYTFDAPSCRHDLQRRLAAAAAAAATRGEAVLGAVMFTCAGRTHHFFGEPNFDASAFAKVRGPASLVRALESPPHRANPPLPAARAGIPVDATHRYVRPGRDRSGAARRRARTEGARGARRMHARLHRHIRPLRRPAPRAPRRSSAPRVCQRRRGRRRLRGVPTRARGARSAASAAVGRRRARRRRWLVHHPLEPGGAARAPNPLAQASDGEPRYRRAARHREGGDCEGGRHRARAVVPGSTRGTGVPGF